MTIDLLFICGGAWSGKTARATHLASRHSEIVWLGTAANTVYGINERVEMLKAARPRTWVNVDTPFDLPTAFSDARKRYPNALIIIDSVSQWIGNEIAKMSTKHDEWQLAEAITRDIDDFCSLLERSNRPVIVTSSDFGQSPPPQEPSSRVLRMCTGRTNQRLSALANVVELMMAGIVYSTTTKGL